MIYGKEAHVLPDEFMDVDPLMDDDCTRRQKRRPLPYADVESISSDSLIGDVESMEEDPHEESDIVLKISPYSLKAWSFLLSGILQLVSVSSEAAFLSLRSLLPHWNLSGARFSRVLRRMNRESGAPSKPLSLSLLNFVIGVLSLSITADLAASDLVFDDLNARRAR